MKFRLRQRGAPLLALAAASLLGACGPSLPAASEKGQARCRQQSAGVAAGSAREQALRSCLATVDAVLAGEAAVAARREARIARRMAAARRAAERCRAERPELLALIEELRSAERDLASVRADTYVPAEPPPRWNETRESRFRQEDQDLDRARHEAALAGWEGRESSRRRAWQSDRLRREAEAQRNLNLAARQLRSRRPELFTSPASIEFEGTALRRLTGCEPRDLLATIPGA